MVTQMVTFGFVDQSHIYKSDLWPFLSETPKCCPCYLSMGIRLFQDSPGRFRDGYGDLLRDFLMMMVMYLSFISEPLSWICGYIFPQMVVISSEIRVSVQQMIR